MTLKDKPTLILINPGIHDFAAYDFWSKPLGLLYLAGYLREKGFDIHLLDCLDIHHPGLRAGLRLKAPKRQAFGTGKFWREQIPRPEPLKHIRRPFHRYGIPPDLILQDLQKVRDPVAVLVTSLMTYWYPGVQEAIGLVRQVHARVPVILGGIYARLCPEHARHTSGADLVVEAGGLAALASISQILNGKTEPMPLRWDHLPYPAFDLYPKIETVTLMTSVGCPFRCHYCAGPFLNPGMARRPPLQVLDEILFWHRRYGVTDFAFYDDALLIDFENHLGLLLEEVIKQNLNLRFHTPNAVHIRAITPETAKLLQRAGFQTLRLGLETADMEWRQGLDQKVATGEFERAVGHLKAMGFTKKELGVYLLAGLPGQSADSVRQAIQTAHDQEVDCSLSEYSPLPHTALWDRAKACSDYDLEAEPLFQNKSILPCWDEIERSRMPELKKRVKGFRLEKEA
ncbi:MAG: radical SAM protein [Desulfobacteraceae bacterium]|nr:MAG: radical SAM protein [Desulfobacteraceae bacterium]